VIHKIYEKRGKYMRFRIGATAFGLMIVAAFAAPHAIAWDRGHVDVLAVLPDVTPGVQSSVEGLTVGPDGNIYVPSFGFNTKGAIDYARTIMPRALTAEQRKQFFAPAAVHAAC